MLLPLQACELFPVKQLLKLQKYRDIIVAVATVLARRQAVAWGWMVQRRQW